MRDGKKWRVASDESGRGRKSRSLSTGSESYDRSADPSGAQKPRSANPSGAQNRASQNRPERKNRASVPDRVGAGGINAVAAAEGRKKDGDVKSPLQIRRAERFLSAQADPLQEQRAREASTCSARSRKAIRDASNADEGGSKYIESIQKYRIFPWGVLPYSARLKVGRKERFFAPQTHPERPRQNCRGKRQARCASSRKIIRDAPTGAGVNAQRK